MDVSMLFIPGVNTYLSGGKLPTCSSTGLFLWCQLTAFILTGCLSSFFFPITNTGEKAEDTRLALVVRLFVCRGEADVSFIWSNATQLPDIFRIVSVLFPALNSSAGMSSVTDNSFEVVSFVSRYSGFVPLGVWMDFSKLLSLTSSRGGEEGWVSANRSRSCIWVVGEGASANEKPITACPDMPPAQASLGPGRK